MARIPRPPNEAPREPPPGIQADAHAAHAAAARTAPGVLRRRRTRTESQDTSLKRTGNSRAGGNAVLARPVWPQSLALLTIAACTPANEIARQGRPLIIGMDASTLQSCAGIPTRIAQLNSRTQLYSYENKYERTGGLEITLPIIGGGIAAGGSGWYCHALVRIVDGKVAGVTYTGDNDDFIGREGVGRPDLSRLPAGAGESARGAPSRGGLTFGRLVGGCHIESPPAWLRRVG